MFRKVISICIQLSGLNWILQQLCKHNPIVFCYHRISIPTFRKHVMYLTKNYSIFPLQDLLDNYYNSENKYKSAIAITMDDCYHTSFLNAVEVCNEYDIHCTYFLPTSYAKKKESFWSLKIIHFFNELKTPATFIDTHGQKISLVDDAEKNKYASNWIQNLMFGNIQTDLLEELVEAFYTKNGFKSKAETIISEEIIHQNFPNKLISFQSHTSTHPKLNMCSDELLNQEFSESKNYLETLFPDEVQHIICYPYGTYFHIGKSYMNASMYYSYGVTLVKGVISSKTNKMLVPRIGLYEQDTIHSIRLKIFQAQVLHLFKTFIPTH